MVILKKFYLYILIWLVIFFVCEFFFLMLKLNVIFNIERRILILEKNNSI